MIIKGKYNEAIVYTDSIEKGALKQIKDLCDIESFANAKIRIMPDVHVGKGCVIGFTANLGDKVIPNIVGVDIGCGMMTVKLGNADIDFSSLDAFIHMHIPSGKSINVIEQADFMSELETLRMLKDSKQDLKKWNRAIGSLGGGNHFIEINIDDDANKYLVVHSGSRNLGHVVASYYQKKAIAYQAGRIKHNKEFHGDKAKAIPDDVCYLEGDLRKDYLHDMSICQRFAKLNRETIAKRILMHLFGHDQFESFHTTHNFIDFDDNIVRKGAIKATKGTEVLIPINMRDGSILAIGKGNEAWNWSAPHGAGRLMSRTKAFETFGLEEFQEEMKGIYSTSVTQKTLDESPMAYKSIDDILKYIEETVVIKAILNPVYNFKSQ